MHSAATKRVWERGPLAVLHPTVSIAEPDPNVLQHLRCAQGPVQEAGGMLPGETGMD